MSCQKQPRPSRADRRADCEFLRRPAARTSRRCTTFAQVINTPRDRGLEGSTELASVFRNARIAAGVTRVRRDLTGRGLEPRTIPEFQRALARRRCPARGSHDPSIRTLTTWDEYVAVAYRERESRGQDANMVWGWPEI